MLEPDRLITKGNLPEDEIIDITIRPKIFADYIGQKSVKKQMKIFIREYVYNLSEF